MTTVFAHQFENKYVSNSVLQLISAVALSQLLGVHQSVFNQKTFNSNEKNCELFLIG